MSVDVGSVGAPLTMSPDAATAESWSAVLAGVVLVSDPLLAPPPRRWVKLDGWDSRGSRTALAERISSRPGATSSGKALKSLTFTVTVNALDTQDQIYAFQAALEQAVTLDPVLMSVDDAWGTWTRTVQLITAEQPQFAPGTFAQVFDLVAADPRRYGPAKTAVAHAFETSVIGVLAEDPFPWVFPVVAAGSLVIQNNGTMEAPVVFTITGPCSRPSITLDGHLLVWDTTLAAGQTLTVDTDAHTSLLGSGGDLSALMISRDFANAPVGTSTAQLGAATATGDASLTARWADTRP